jgi:hypothetical protein
MGLDMYLRAKRYLRSYNNEDLSAIKAIADLNIKGTVGMEPKEVSFSAMYWRKSNHIHAWFVDNVQDGEDDCKPYEVGHEQLHELLALCKQVLEDKGSAPDLLPLRSGFFFGSDEYDKWYYDDLQETVDRLGQILSSDGADYLDFEYQSSW